MPGSRLALLAEVAGFVGFSLLTKYLLSLVIWRYAGPVSLLLTLAVLTLYLRTRGVGWASLGLRPLPGWRAKLMVVPQALLRCRRSRLSSRPPPSAGRRSGWISWAEVSGGVDDRWGEVAGSLPHYLLWLGIVWTAAAFGEEMFFRGYLITRLGAAFGGGRGAAVAAVILSAAIFGYGHFYYQGLRGAVVTGGIGLAFGTMFLLFRRNLWPLILLHGVIDTLTFTALYMEWK